MKANTRWTVAAIAGAVVAAGSITAALLAGPRTAPVEVVVYKAPTCGCCTAWVEHMRAAGFKVITHDQDDLSQVKAGAGVPSSLGSCHTAIVASKYVIEGHVPAATIKRLLAEQPKIAGLAAPGMPAGSPGMEGPRKDPYNVIAFDGQGNQQIYEKH